MAGRRPGDTDGPADFEMTLEDFMQMARSIKEAHGEDFVRSCMGFEPREPSLPPPPASPAEPPAKKRRQQRKTKQKVPEALPAAPDAGKDKSGEHEILQDVLMKCFDTWRGKSGLGEGHVFSKAKKVKGNITIRTGGSHSAHKRKKGGGRLPKGRERTDEEGDADEETVHSSDSEAEQASEGNTKKPVQTDAKRKGKGNKPGNGPAGPPHTYSEASGEEDETTKTKNKKAVKKKRKKSTKGPLGAWDSSSESESTSTTSSSGSTDSSSSGEESASDTESSSRGAKRKKRRRKSKKVLPFNKRREPRGRPTPVMQDAIHWQLPTKVKRQIWSKQYVNIFSLTGIDEDGLDLSSMTRRARGKRVGGRVKKEKTLANWMDGFRMLTSTMLEKFPELGASMVAYAQRIKDAHNTYGGMAWYEYDKSFRLRMQKWPSIGFDEEDMHGYMKRMTAAKVVPNQGRQEQSFRFRAQADRPRYAGPAGARGQGSEIRPSAVCLDFSRGNCTFGFRCRYAHRCTTCGGAGHPAGSCWQRGRATDRAGASGPTRSAPSLVGTGSAGK